MQIGNAPHRRIGDGDGQAHEPIHIGYPAQLLAQEVVERREPEPQLVDFGGRKHVRVGKHILVGMGENGRPGERQRGHDGVLIGPAIAAEPLRLGALIEIDALIELLEALRGRLGIQKVIGHGRVFWFAAGQYGMYLTEVGSNMLDGMMFPTNSRRRRGYRAESAWIP